MLPATFRLVFRRGKRAENKYFRVHRIAGETEFGMAVSAKVGNAVVRNRIQRLLRVSLRDIDGQVVIVAKPPAADIRGHQDELDAQLRPLLIAVGAVSA